MFQTTNQLIEIDRCHPSCTQQKSWIPIDSFGEADSANRCAATNVQTVHELCTVRSWAWVVSSVAKGYQSTRKFGCCCSDPNKRKVEYHQKFIAYVISYLKIISCQGFLFCFSVEWLYLFCTEPFNF